ncbi:hypothetical protein [Melghirimyces thermohalophilus]|uniref:hypothetical protein n=1 Tax=Melghirimyces thermohalophilus TaxID=1236220 RepID=UPI0015A16AB3|nr:hypothetical protein [Melghirimyces thermohalophilus]
MAAQTPKGYHFLKMGIAKEIGPCPANVVGDGVKLGIKFRSQGLTSIIATSASPEVFNPTGNSHQTGSLQQAAE